MLKTFAFFCRLAGLAVAIVLAGMSLRAEHHGQSGQGFAVLAIAAVIIGMGPTFVISKD